MIIRGHPKDVYNYVSVGLDLSHQLHKLGFPPMYMEGNVFFHKRTPEMENIYKKLLSKGGEDNSKTI